MIYDLFEAPSTEPKLSALDEDALSEAMNDYDMTEADKTTLRERGYVSFNGTTLILQPKETA